MKDIIRQASGVAIGVAIAVGMFTVLTATADEKKPSAVEHAVINCNQNNVSGHGGTADNPPKCEEDMEEQEEQTEELPAQTTDWVNFVKESKMECISAQAEADLRANAMSMGQDRIFQDDKGNKAIDVAGASCVRVSISIDARGSASVR